VRVTSDGSRDDEKMRQYFSSEARLGVTGNLFMEYNPGARVEQLARLNAPFRVWVMPFAQYETGQKRRRLEQVTVPPGIADRVTSHGEKWVLDGEPVHRTAPMRAPYADDPTTSGQTDYPDAEVRAILSEAVQHNLPLMIHVTADRSTEQLLNQMDATGGEKVWANRRLRIEHGDGLMDDLIPGAKKLGVVVAENPMYLGVPLKQLGPHRTPIWTPCRSLLEAGIPLVLASDGRPDFPFLNPFLNMQIATTYPPNPKEAITREQALIAFTRTAAYSVFAEERLGTLDAGKQADLAVLSQDIFTVSNEDLPKTESVLTIVGGRVAYSRDVGQTAVSPVLR
jgi:predicted amidohydrolase YtcJ